QATPSSEPKPVSKPLVLIGEARGAEEDRIGTSFVGASGVALLRMLHEAAVIELTAVDWDYINDYYRNGRPQSIAAVWALHPEVHRTNVFEFHPHANDIDSLCGPKAEAIGGYPSLGKSRYVRAEFVKEIERLQDELISIDPNLIVPLGNTALW